MSPLELTLQNESLRWDLQWTSGPLRTVGFRNALTDSTFGIGEARELTLVLSAEVDRVAEQPTRVEDFEVAEVESIAPDRASFALRSPGTGLEATLHYALEGSVRRKWVEVTNGTDREVLLLDVELDRLTVGDVVTGGGPGFPLFLADEAWLAVEYPSGDNQAQGGQLTLSHFPGRRLRRGESYTSHAALVSVSESGQAEASFVRYIDARARRKRRVLSIYTPFGVNNQWGPCSTLTDEETLHVLRRLEAWQKEGVRFDYFTLDTGWVDPSSDLTAFRPTCYPNGPTEVVRKVEALGMQFGLWFATSWAAESCWDHPAAWPGDSAPTMGYLNGVPARAHFGGSLCFGYRPYVDMLRHAVLHHIREHGVRFVKLDGGSYHCDSAEHGHLPGKYSTERMCDNLVELADAAREAAPDVFVMWYWGLRSPFWALHGDSIFESGLHMEGSGTSGTPTLYYRDSVTLAQDQNAQHARLIPPLVKDSLGVWLADTRWGNFMGQERWRESLVMDLGRGSLLFPNLWGDLYLLDEADVTFLAWISQLARGNEALFLHRRTILGDPWRDEVYGYAHCEGERGFLFLNNAHFAARSAELRLDESIGLSAPRGARLNIRARFPEEALLRGAAGSPVHVGDTLAVWLRPFETLMLEIMPAGQETTELPVRTLSEEDARDLGAPLALERALPALEVQFVEAARFARQGSTQQAQGYRAQLPPLDGPQPILAVAVQLRQGGEEWRYSPVVAEIVQVRARIAGRNVQLVPVPDARQFGNTQKAGCSWVVYKVRLSREWSGKPVELAVHAWLPEGVEAHTEAWVVKRWWREDSRPTGDGYYGDAPS